MKARLNHLVEALRGSLWLIPSLMSLGAALLAVAMLALDARMSDRILPSALSFQAGPEAARALLTTLAGAMMGVVGVTFSITIVALTLASQQFGPRLLRNFLQDRANQVVLGTFIATFTYSLLVLQAVRGGELDGQFPRLAVTVAMLIALASLGTLIYFIHHVAHGIQADAIIASVASELDASIDRMYPEQMGHDAPEDDPEALIPPGFDEEAVALRSPKSGYLQAIEEDDLVALAVEEGLLLHLVHRPGDFLVEGSPLVRVWPPDRLTPGLEERLAGFFIVGLNRTPEQDVEFAIDQLVEVAVRALSPGINDPFTAMRCVDRLGAGLCRLCARRFPSPYRKDDRGKLRVVARRPDFEGIVNASFDQIRQYGRSSVSVTIRLFETIEVVAGCAAGRPALRDPLRAQAERIYQGAAGQEGGDLLEADRNDIERRYRDAKAALERVHRDVAPSQPRKRSRKP